MLRGVAEEELPLRELTDPKALKALAHPARLRLLEELAAGGPMTATELGRLVGQSAANCSWHLRHLAHYGFVAEAGGGTGRQRPWRVVPARHRWGEGPLADPETELAGAALSDLLVAHEVEAMRAGLAASRTGPAEWRDATFLTQTIGWLTAAELADVQSEVHALLFRYADRALNPEARPPDSRLIRFAAWGVPAVPKESRDQKGPRP
jgi:DNA-binding transcriptional ArsR family regulator